MAEQDLIVGRVSAYAAELGRPIPGLRFIYTEDDWFGPVRRAGKSLEWAEAEMKQHMEQIAGRTSHA